jgi:hypothetical protein
MKSYAFGNWLTAVFVLSWGMFCTHRCPLHAQSPDTVRVKLNSPTLVQSSITLFQNALYRWTVQGRGSIGQVSMANTVVDARYFVSNFSLPSVQRPVLPLDANGSAAVQYCAAFQSTPAASPCNIYLATNALKSSPTSPATLDPTFRLTNAVQMKKYAFVSDENTFNSASTYTAAVRGANVPAQFVFVEGLGFGNNTSYSDNDDTSLVVRIERRSPELVLRANAGFALVSNLPGRILNDNNPKTVLRDTTLDFGAFLVGSPVQTRRLVVRNRGVETLAITGVEVMDPDGLQAQGVFGIRFGDGAGQMVNRVLNQTADSLELTFQFQPREAGQKTLELRIYTNDSTQERAPDGRRYFRLRLVGAGALGTLRSAPDLLEFGDVRVGSQLTRSYMLSRAVANEVFRIDSVRPPSLPFSIPAFDFLTVTPLSFDIGSPDYSGSVQFTPDRIGEYRDSIVLRGQNLVEYKIFFRARAIKADAVITNAQTSADADTVRFGDFVTGMSSVATVSIENTGNLALEVVANASTSDFVVLSPSLAIPDSTGVRRTIVVRFDATPFQSIGNKVATLTVIAREAANTSTVAAQRRFVLLANRLPNIIQTVRRSISFDSVYVGASGTDTTLVRNSSGNNRRGFTASILTQNLQPAPVSASAFTTDTLRVRQFNVATTSALKFTFTPRVRGVDTARFRLQSVIDSTGGIEETSVSLRGVGVQQQLGVQRVVLDSIFPNNTIIGLRDTLLRGSRAFVADIGCARLGTAKTVRVVFRNNGNIPFVAWNQFSRLEPQTPAGQQPVFAVTRLFPQNLAVQPNAEEQSLTIRFTPTLLGIQQIEHTIQSDIRRANRVQGAPDSTEQIIVILRGTGVVPEVRVPVSLSFDDVALGSSCFSRSRQLLTILNPSDAACGLFTRVLTATISSANPSAGTPFRIIGSPTPLSIPASTSASIELEYLPTTLGDSRAEIVLTTDAPAPNNVLRVPILGRAVAQASVRLSIPNTLRARPGTRIAVPVVVQASTTGNQSANAQALQTVNAATFQLSFDASLLYYAGIAETLGTAAEGASLTTEASVSAGRGTLRVNLKALPGDRFRARETLVTLLFDTYLGRKTSTEISISSARLSDDFCTEKVRIQSIQNGAFLLDSVCGLQAKTLSISTTTFALLEPSPNPVKDDGSITFHVAYQTPLTITLLDAYGTLRAVIADGVYPSGVYEARLPVAELPSGVYFCTMQAGRFSETRKIIIMR